MFKKTNGWTTLTRPGAFYMVVANATKWNSAGAQLRALALCLLTLPCAAGRAEDHPIGGWRPIGHELYEDTVDLSAFDSPEPGLLPILADLARDGIRYKLNRYHTVGVDVLGEQDPTEVMLQWSIDLY